MSGINLRRWRAEHWWLALLAAALLALALAGAAYVVRKHQWATRTMSDASPRVARLSGMAQGGGALKRVQQSLQANLEQFVWGSGQSATAIGNTALQRVREQAAKHELSVSSSQSAVAAHDEAGFERINLDVRVEGAWPALMALLDDIARTSPAVYLDSAQIGPVGRSIGGEQSQLAARLSLFVLRHTP